MFLGGFITGAIITILVIIVFAKTIWKMLDDD